MVTMTQRHHLQSQAAYSELAETLQVAEIEALYDREGSLTRREVRGRHYWYIRRRVGHRVQEHYVGPETDELLARLDSLKEEVAHAKTAAKHRRTLIRMLRAAGYATTDRGNGKILEELALAGVFWLQGVLVGSHAFRCYGALLGARIDESLALTNDLDLAQGNTLALALGESASPPLAEAISRAEKFVRIPELDPKMPSTSWRTADQELRIDVLTPLVGKGKEGPIELKSLGTHATALRFLDFLLAETQPAAVLTGSGILVRVPTPERFALHKLIVSQRRGTHERGKSAKDVAQAGALLDVLLEDRSGDLADAWDELKQRGKKWEVEAKRGVKLLPEDVAQRLKQEILV